MKLELRISNLCQEFALVWDFLECSVFLPKLARKYVLYQHSNVGPHEPLVLPRQNGFKTRSLQRGSPNVYACLQGGVKNSQNPVYVVCVLEWIPK